MELVFSSVADFLVAFIQGNRNEPTAPASSTDMDLTSEEAAREREEQADRHIAEQNLDAALHYLDKAIFLQPNRALLYAKRAQVFWELCDLKSAMASYRKLFSIDSSPPQRIKDRFAALLNLHGYSLLMLNETPSIAIAYLTEAIQLNGLEETYWLHRALAHIQANCFDKALKDIDHCICLNARDVEYFVLRAKLHWRLHMHGKANSDIQRAAKLSPDHPEVVEHEQRLLKESQAIFEQACKHSMLKEFADVIKCLNKAAEISPEETRFYLLRASAYRELGEYHVALKDVERALDLYRKKMELVQKNRQMQEGVGQREISNSSSNSSSSTPRALAPVIDRSKEYREIATQRNLILTDIALRFLRGKSYQLALNALNQAIRGEAELADLFHEKCENPNHFVSRGDAYRGLDNFQAALADYHRALEILPDSDEIKSRVAVIHYQFGIQLFNRAQFEKAELEFYNAIAQNPSVAEYYVRKGDSERYLEKHEAACVDYQRALQLNPRDQDTKVRAEIMLLQTTRRTLFLLSTMHMLLGLQNKLLQYSVRPLPVAAKAPAPRSIGNQQFAREDYNAPTRNVSCSPRPCTRSEGAATSAISANNRIEEARKSYEKKNRAVQELFLNRPALPTPKKKS